MCCTLSCMADAVAPVRNSHEAEAPWNAKRRSALRALVLSMGGKSR
jgi:hypothetical protein